jgi:uncharacterized protein YdeI (YjbR/CyaY-like superfamily)
MPEQLLEFADRAAWRAWLEAHHAEAREAWLIHYKVGAGKRWLTYEEGVEEALCFGWIDGLLRSMDAERYSLRYSPRRRRSMWSESNIRRVEKLVAEGRMTAAGLAKVAEAKESGEWEAAIRRRDVSTIPEDLERALASHEGALAAFKAWTPSRIRRYLWWIESAKRAATRERRIAAVVDKVLGDALRRGSQP